MTKPREILHLADEVLTAMRALMDECPDGPSLAAIARMIGADRLSVGNAAITLNREGRADLMRRRSSREQFLLPFRHRGVDGLPICANCGASFDRPPKKRGTGWTRYSNRRTCSRSCAVAVSWKSPEVAGRRINSIKAERRTPKALARTALLNEKRWSRPGEREKAAAQSRARWADPNMRALMSQAIQEIQRTPEMRKLYSDLRKEWWKDPLMREKMSIAAKKAKSTPEFREYFSELCRKRWRDPEWRKKWLPAVRKNAAKAGRISQEKRRARREAERHA